MKCLSIKHTDITDHLTKSNKNWVARDLAIGNWIEGSWSCINIKKHHRILLIYYIQTLGLYNGRDSFVILVWN